MAGETILVVDDEGHIVDLTRMYLEADGYRVLTAGDGEQALRLWREEQPALIVLDLMLPKIDGWDVCRRIRAESDVPIIMLTARSDDVDKIVGLELGADDYVTKPFNPRELVARVRAVLRRVAHAPDVTRPLMAGPLRIDPARREATLNGRPLKLRAKEFDLLHTLVEHQGLVLSRDQLLNRVWGYDFVGETRTVDVHIARLREKLRDSPVVIETVWGVGYKLVVVDQAG
ncbi:MAG TPA: response regulator transcription factor [Caldilineae bacterium]|nr:response regulator transcription factor [Caldilineae bacterium]